MFRQTWRSRYYPVWIHSGTTMGVARSKQFSTIMVVSHMQSLTDSFDANGVDDEVVVGRIELSKLPSGAMYRGARKRVAPTPPLPKRCKT